ncbi:MAG: PT domain-containing protein [Parasporobacterium sp.]|nr:PT domain-containing protein [Parasporobacterium sp.]
MKKKKMIQLCLTCILAVVLMQTAVFANGIPDSIQSKLTGQKLHLVNSGAESVSTVAEDITEEITEAVTEAPTEAPTEPPTEAPTEVPTEPPTEAPAKTLTERLLEDLQIPELYMLNEYLSTGATVGRGADAQTGTALQILLNALGQNIVVDGSVGNGTISALNNVISCLGVQSQEVLNLELFEPLLCCAFIRAHEDDEIDNPMLDFYGVDVVYYLSGCAYCMTGEFYDAKLYFGWSDYEGSLERAAACVQPLPANGELYHNPAYYSSETLLQFVVEQSSGGGAYFKLYAENGDIVSTVFVNGVGYAETWIPGGTYMIKEGYGTEWYGIGDAFGSGGSYGVMTFGDYDYENPDAAYKVYLAPWEGYTITINVAEMDPDAAGVGSDYLSSDEF